MSHRIGFWIGMFVLLLAFVVPASRLLEQHPMDEEIGALEVVTSHSPAAPNAPAAPEDIACRPNEVATNQVRIEWKDTNSGGGNYDLYRKEVSAANWDLLTTIAANTCEDEKCKYVDAGASNSTVYHYRIQANDGSDTSSFSDICREPLFVDDSTGNFRAFYRLSECPNVDGKKTCTQNVTNNGQNVHVMQMLATHELFRNAYINLGFNNYAVYKGAKPYPIDMYPCNNGCKNSAGIQIPPGNLEGADYDPATGGGNDYEVFVVGHEAFHAIQSSYGTVDDPYYKWLIEGQARSTEDKSCIFSNQTDCTLWDNQIDKYYAGAASSYLGFPEQGLLDASYIAALFWTYVTEQTGTLTDEPTYGMDALVNYWKQNQINSDANNAKDGIGTLNDMLTGIGAGRQFQDIFQDFAVANYVKDYVTEPAPAGFERYNYIDEEAYIGGTYGNVKLTTSGSLAPDGTIFGTTSVQAWGARYFELDPDAAVPSINIEVETLAATKHSLYYHVVAIEGGSIVEQWIDSGTSLALSIDNSPDYDRIALIVASRDNPTNFTYGFNLTDGLFILSPTQQLPAAVGETTSPEKFILQVQVLDEVGDPVAGIDTSQFTITVGSSVINPPANLADPAIIGSSYIAGQYWLTIRAPGSPGCTSCDLTVAYAAYSDTELDAIQYGPKPDVDNMIIIDRSGSMLGNKIVAAQDAAKLYADSYSEGDRIGILSFNEAPNSEYPLSDWTAANRPNVQAAIDGLAAPAGNTANGAALREGTTQLEAQASPNPAWAIVLLSDGKDTVAETDDHIAAYVSEWKTKFDAGDQVPVIHVVAVGDDADGVELSKLTNISSGLFQFLPVPGEMASVADVEEVNAVNLAEGLAEIYRVFAEDVLDEQQVFVHHFSKAAGDSALVIDTIQVDKATSQAIFVLKYSPTSATLPTINLIPPGGSTGDAVAPTLTANGHLIWRIPTPLPGEWTLALRFGCSPNCPTDYLVEAALVSDLTLKAFLGVPVEERIVGKPMPIIAFLSDIDPLTGATVTALSERTGELITLHDDGSHGDGKANDGAYGGTLLSTNQDGGYSVVIDAQGDSPFAGPYTRRARLAFFLPDGPDSDGDRLPDWWEEEHSTDPTKPDADADPDGDGLPNTQEYFRKTHPLDPDTDDGGENDGSEVGRGANPLLPSDDGGKPSVFKPWPGPGRIILRLVFPSAVESFTVERATSPAGPFTVVESDLPPQAEWIDTTVSNDQLTCYRIVSQGRGSSSTSLVQCTTPKLDPHPPHGVVTGLETVAVSAGLLAVPNAVPITVSLMFDASDDPTTEEHPVFDGAFLFSDARISGVSEMMISNRSDFEGAVWELYQATKKWVLAPRTDGLATVHVLFRDAAGNVSDVAHETFMVDASLSDDSRLLLPRIRRQ
jgi:hypothetical protein